MTTIGIIGINGMVGQKMLAQLQKIKPPLNLKRSGVRMKFPRWILPYCARIILLAHNSFPHLKTV